jgi:hypothetical protein
LNGQAVQSETINAVNGIAIDLGKVSTGMYLLEIRLANGNIIRTQVVKE